MQEYLSQNNKNQTKRRGAAIIAASLAALWLIIEVILFVLSIPGAEQTDFYKVCTGIEANEKITVTSSKTFKLSDDCGAIETLSFDAVVIGDRGAYETVSVTVSGYDPAVSRRITYKVQKFCVGNGKSERTVVRVDIPKNAAGLSVVFSHDGFDYELSNFKINSPDDASFNWGRSVIVFVIIALCWMSVRLDMWKTLWDCKKHGYLALVICLVCVMIATMATVALNPNREKTEYPLKGSVASYNQYIQQFDALQKGQLHIDFAPSKELLELENPYDYGSRDGVYYLWDRAFYDGKYYSYFGMAPILTVYYPYHALTGHLPSDDTVTAIFTVMTALFFSMAAVKWASMTSKKLPVAFVFIGTVCALASSQVFLIMRGYGKVYYIATIAGMAFLSMFIWLFLCGISGGVKLDTRKGKSPAWVRLVLLFLAGIAFGLCFLSRFNIALLAAFAIVPMLWFCMIRPYGEDGKGKFKRLGEIIPQLVCLAIPVAAALGYQLWLNAARFDSIFEFGTTYQLTVSDVSLNKLRLSDLPATIFHYFIHPISLMSDAPMVSLFYTSLSNYGHYVYVDTGMGLLSIPLMWGLFGSVGIFISKKYKLGSKLTLASVLLGLVAVAWFDFCLGGVIFRYTCDLTLLASFTSMAVVWAVYEDITDQSSVSVRTVNIAVTALFVLSAMISVSLALSINGNLTTYSPRLYVWFRSLFGG